ncbi:hypothetical protein EMIHUDRAFT_372634, partial [Emiliania huxleyi CCMP1516]
MSNDVVQAIESLPIGRFHHLHLARQICAWACFALCQECAAYIFDALEQQWLLSADDLGYFASAFPAGCVVGSLASAALLDRFGRRPALVAGTAAAAFCGALAAASPRFEALLLLRGAQAASWAYAQAAATAWYAEFLPTAGRGPLIAAVSIGWPVGRGVAISLAAALSWRA